MDGWMVGWMDGWMDECCLFQTHKIYTIHLYRSIASYKENILTKGVHDMIDCLAL